MQTFTKNKITFRIDFEKRNVNYKQRVIISKQLIPFRLNNAVIAT